MLNGKFALGRVPGTDYPLIHIFQGILERTDTITKEDLEPTTFVLAYPTLYVRVIKIIFLSLKLIEWR